MVQWLKFCTSNAGSMGSIPGQGGSARHVVAANICACVRVSVCVCVRGFPGGSAVKSPSAKHETQVRSLSQKDRLKKETATHSSTLAWKILWTEEPGRLQTMRSKRISHD